jgi:hypothetical protein
MPRRDYARPGARMGPAIRQAEPAHQPHHFEHRKLDSNPIANRRLKIWLSLVAAIVIAGGLYFGFAARDTQPHLAAKTPARSLIQPAFSVYYPNHPPVDLTIINHSIASSADSFSFNLAQAGQTRIFVSEQPAIAGSSLNQLKAKLTSPSEYSVPLGRAVFGGLAGGIVTALVTSDKTLIIINCADTICTTISSELLKTMQLNTDFDLIRRTAS